MRHPAVLLLIAQACLAQGFTQRGFLETRFLGFPQTVPGDSGRAVGEAFLRWEPSFKPVPGLQVFGVLDARVDSHRQADRAWDLDWQDRRRRRPPFALRRLSALYHRGPLTAEIGKQFIRWGKADILNPTDRFAPRDFLAVVDNEFLAVTAARLTWESPAHTVDLVWTPRFTSSRLPLLNQRWAALPEGIAVTESPPRFPGGPQFGARWSRRAARLEHSFSFFQGFNHLPLLDIRVLPALPFRFRVEPFYARMRMAGAEAALPLPWLTVKAEAAYFTSSTRQADEYVLYVIQLERQTGEWFLVGGYAGEAVTRSRAGLDFAPDRGLARAFLGRAGYNIDPNRSIAVEAAVRHNGRGVWTRAEYSQALGRHWRATAGFTWMAGKQGDFLGQYRRNSHASLALRFSF